MAEKTGVTLEIEAPPISNYTDRLQLVMASGDLPDIIYTWEFDQNYEKWANDGLILPLDEYIEDYPNLMANISEGQWGKARVGGADGQIYAVPRPTGSASWGVISNDEWLEKLGVDMPPHRRKPMNTASWSLHRTRMETARTIRSCIPRTACGRTAG